MAAAEQDLEMVLMKTGSGGRRRRFHKLDEEGGSECNMLDSDSNLKKMPRNQAEKWFEKCGTCFSDE